MVVGMLHHNRVLLIAVSNMDNKVVINRVTMDSNNPTGNNHTLVINSRTGLLLPRAMPVPWVLVL